MKKASLLVLFLTVFIDLLGFGIVIPLLAYFAREYGASGRMVGAVVSAYSLMQFFFSPMWGRLSDRIGRRPVLMISLAGSVAGNLLFAFAGSLATLFLARVVAGIAAANIGTAQAYIADVTTPENRAKGMGLIGVAFGLGFVLGPPVGGILAYAAMQQGLAGNFYPGLAAAALSLVALSVAVFALRESKVPDSEPVPAQSRFAASFWRSLLARPPLGTILLTWFLITVAFAGMETTITLHGRDRFSMTPRDLGYFFAVMGVVVALIQGGGIGKLARRFGEANLAVVGCLSLSAGLFMVPLIYERPLLYVAALLIAAGQGLCFPSLSSLVTRSAARQSHGSALGLSASVSSLSRVVGPLLAGAVYDAAGSVGPFYVGGALVVGAFFLALTLRSVKFAQDPA